MLSNFVDLSKVNKFFRIGGNNDEFEEYQAINGSLEPMNPYMDDEIIENHNLSERGRVTHMKSKYSHMSHKYHFPSNYGTNTSVNDSNNNNNEKHTQSMIVHFDKDSTEDGQSRPVDNSNESDTLSSSVSSDGTDILDIDSKSPPLLGMILVTISAVCYAALNLSVKALMDETPWQELMIIRMGITWIATMAWIFIKYRGDMSLWGPKDKRLLLTWRAFFLWGAMFCCWWSFEFLPVGDGTTLAMSFPVWVTIIAHFVFRNENVGINAPNMNQRLDKFGWLCVFSGLIGVIFVAQPSFIFGGDLYGPARDVGIVLGLCSALCAGAQYVIVNYTKDDCHWLQVEQITAFLSTFVFMPIGFAIFAAVRYYKTGTLAIGLEGLNGVRWCEEIALGLLGFCALALLTRGSQLDAPARTAICLYLQIPVTYAGQCIMTSTFPNGWVFVGIVLVLVSVLVPGARKLRASNELKLQVAKAREEARIARKTAIHKDIASDVSSDENISVSEEDKDEQPLLDRYSRDDILSTSMTDISQIPKYTINVGRRNSRLYGSRGHSRRYNDYQSSSSDDSL